MQAKNEDRAPYVVTPAHQSDDWIIGQALAILESRMRMPADLLGSPDATKAYLKIKLAGLQHEVFGILWLDAHNRLIEDTLLFRGTTTQTSVYPREVAKEALKHNAVSCIVYHNHPSGTTTPSTADEMLTQKLKTTLEVIDVRLIDHIIVGGVESSSFAERGLL